VSHQHSHGLKACLDAVLEQGKPLSDGQRCYTYRAIGGVSMGGGSAARLAFHYPELFDAVGVMGTPFSDFDYFWTMLNSNHLSGFCPREQLLQVLADNPANPAILDEPSAPGVWCGEHGNLIEGALAIPDTQCWQFASDYNHWWRGPDAGRGGSFRRPFLFEIIQDITATYGNIGFHNPDNPYMPPGVSLAYRVPPGTQGSARESLRTQICANPVVIEGMKHLEWNPDGAYPVITFCDCRDCDGDYIPGDERIPVEVLLAADYNRNGRRDYGEPVVWNPHERYQDVGLDGKDSGAPGDDPTDEHHYLNNPTGQAHNHSYDEGEPFDDHGLDGVPDTADYGEGDGIFTMTPSLERVLADSPTRWYRSMSGAMVKRLDVWMDAGIRDFINSAQITNQLFGAILSRTSDDDTRYFQDFSGLAQLPPGELYDFHQVDFSPSSIGRNSYVLYGDPAICPGTDENFGDGNHVGPANVVINRLLTLFKFADSRMPDGDYTFINSDSVADDHPEGFAAHLKMETFPSKALGRDQPYGVVLPPGYFYPENEEKRYPVVYFLHGQGQSAEDLIASGAVFLGYMFQSSLPNVFDRSDLQKLILVFADGECRSDDCHTGNFYSNFVGVDGNGLKFEDAILELMAHVDETYRTRAPEVH
jgi:hypothetical protein